MDKLNLIAQVAKENNFNNSYCKAVAKSVGENPTFAEILDAFYAQGRKVFTGLSKDLQGLLGEKSPEGYTDGAVMVPITMELLCGLHPELLIVDSLITIYNFRIRNAELPEIAAISIADNPRKKYDFFCEVIKAYPDLDYYADDLIDCPTHVPGGIKNRIDYFSAIASVAPIIMKLDKKHLSRVWREILPRVTKGEISPEFVAKFITIEMVSMVCSWGAIIPLMLENPALLDNPLPNYYVLMCARSKKLDLSMLGEAEKYIGLIGKTHVNALNWSLETLQYARDAAKAYKPVLANIPEIPAGWRLANGVELPVAGRLTGCCQSLNHPGGSTIKYTFENPEKAFELFRVKTTDDGVEHILGSVWIVKVGSEWIQNSYESFPGKGIDKDKFEFDLKTHGIRGFSSFKTDPNRGFILYKGFVYSDLGCFVDTTSWSEELLAVVSKNIKRRSTLDAFLAGLKRAENAGYEEPYLLQPGVVEKLTNYKFVDELVANK